MSNARSSWKSLLSALLDGGAQEFDIYLAEVAPGDGDWDFAFWQFDPDGAMVTYRCPPNRNIWQPVETPSYTGRIRRYERPEEQYSKDGPFNADPDPK